MRFQRCAGALVWHADSFWNLQSMAAAGRVLPRGSLSHIDGRLVCSDVCTAGMPVMHSVQIRLIQCQFPVTLCGLP